MHVIIMDSENASLNKLRPSLEVAMQKSSRTEKYGRKLTGRTLYDFLTEEKIEYEQMGIARKMVIPNNEQAVATFARISAYVFKYDAADVLKHAKNQLEKFMREFLVENQYILFDWQDIFILKKLKSLDL